MKIAFLILVLAAGCATTKHTAKKHAPASPTSVGTEPSAPEDPIATAAQLHKDGELVDAIEAYENILKKNPKDNKTRAALAFARLELSRKWDILSTLQALYKAADATPNDADLHMALAVALQDYGIQDAAMNEYWEAVRLDPDYKTDRRLSKALRARGAASPDAAKVLDSSQARLAALGSAGSLTDAKDLARKHAQLGAIECRTRWRERGIGELKEALKQTPEDPGITIDLAECLRAAGKGSDGEKTLVDYITRESKATPPDPARIDKARKALRALKAEASEPAR